MTNNEPSFSIIIPTYNRFDNLFACLDCLSFYFEHHTQVKLGVAIQVIVSDDAQDPELQALLLKRFPWCIYTPGPSRGPSANRNNGARMASYEWVVFTDDDCLPQPGWIEAYAYVADQFDVMEGRTSAVGIRTRVDEECPINETGGFLWSCNFAIRRNVFLALGGFNETFPAPAMEDVELNVRINKLGIHRRFVPTALVLHPWRSRKGILFINMYASSVARFVSLHPEQAKRFCLRSQLINSLRLLWNTMIYSLFSKQCRGLSRQIFLDSYSCYAAWNSVRTIK